MHEWYASRILTINGNGQLRGNWPSVGMLLTVLKLFKYAVERPLLSNMEPFGWTRFATASVVAFGIGGTVEISSFHRPSASSSLTDSCSSAFSRSRAASTVAEDAAVLQVLAQTAGVRNSPQKSPLTPRSTNQTKDRVFTGSGERANSFRLRYCQMCCNY